jgi:hypothetical protein
VAGAERAGSAGDDLAALVDHMATRLRRFGSRHWREPVDDRGTTAADAVHELVSLCARREIEVAGNRPAAAPEVPTRPAYDAALADQLAVVGRDLSLALVEHGDEAVSAEVLAEVRGFARLLRVEPKP